MSVTTDHDGCAGPVVRGEENDRVIKNAHGAKLFYNPADLAIHRGHHRRMEGHFGGLKTLLLIREIRPCRSQLRFARTQHRQWIGKFGRSQNDGRRDAFRPGCQFCTDQSHLPQSPPSLLANHIPTREIPSFIFRPVAGRRMQGKVRRGVGQI